jgi:PAS domain S-box-containing protein
MPLAESLLRSRLGFVFLFDVHGRVRRGNGNLGALLGGSLQAGTAPGVQELLGLDPGRDPVAEVFASGSLVVEGPWPGRPGGEEMLAWVLHRIDGTDLGVAIGLEEPRRKRVEEALQRRLKFQQLASTISARFVHLAAREVDREISAGLGMLGEFFQLERCTLVEVLPDTKSYQPLHSWVKAGTAGPLDSHTRQFMPMLTDRIRGGEPYFFRGREEIPHNWVHERRFAEVAGIQAALVVPLKVGGTFLGAFLIDSFSCERDWPSEVVEELRFLGGIFANAVARRRVEERLAGSEKRVRMIADALPGLIAYVGGDRRYRFSNQAYERWHGIATEEVYGKTMQEVLGDEVYALARPYVDEALTGVPVRYRMDVPTLGGGDTRFIEASYVPHLDPAGQVLGFYSLVQDITDRRTAEIQAQRQRDELAHVTRVATLGEMAASMVHELNQPLAAMLSSAQAALRFLAADPPNLAEVEAALQYIVADDRRASEVVRSLRAFAVKGGQMTEGIAVNRLVEEVLFLLRNDASLHSVGVTTDLAPGLPAARGDRVQLQQVLVNLVLNGFEAMEGTPTPRELAIRTTLDEEGRLRVAVSDTGPGIAPELSELVFDAFFTTKDKGMGMGLSISRSIAEAHGGRLRVAGGGAAGATFHLTLPTHAPGPGDGPGAELDPRRGTRR